MTSGNELATQEKIELAKELAAKYEYGSLTTPINYWKAYHYKKMAGLPVKEPKFSKKILDIENFYTIFWYLNDLRLKTVNTNSALGLVGKSFLSRLFGIAGFCYLVRAAIDIGICIHAGLREPTASEVEKMPEVKNMNFWKNSKINSKRMDETKEY